MPETKILTRFWGTVDPKEIESYWKKGGYNTLKRVLAGFSPSQAVQTVKESGLCGRGGAGFKTGEKWEIAVRVPSKERYFICNLDESEPGTFKDLMLAENNPHQLLEGIIIACYALGVKKAFIYLNGKFRQAEYLLRRAIEQAYAGNILGQNILGFAYDLDLEIFMGAGAYICGEESALINSLAGQRSEPRLKPPYPCNCGLEGKPTVVNNAETISALPWIFRQGADAFAAIGSPRSPGTKLFSVDGAVKRPGIYEAPIGVSIRDIIFDYAQGLEDGKEFWFAQVGGASGRIVTAALLDEIPGYSPDSKIPMGSGAIVVVDRFQDGKKFLLSLMSFFQRESCGKCVPCREGSFRLRDILLRLCNGNFTSGDKEDMEKLIWILDNTTFCPLGKFSVSALKDFIKYKIIHEIS